MEKDSKYNDMDDMMESIQQLYLKDGAPNIDNYEKHHIFSALLKR